MKVAIYSVAFSLPFGLGLGYFLARKSFFGKSIFESVITLPLVLPPVTTGYLLLLAFGRNSLLGGWIYETFGIKIAFSFLAAIIASIVVSFPLLVRSIRTSIEMIDSEIEDVAFTLGASKWKTFRQVVFPLALPGVISGTILAFARSLGEFGATITFAGNIQGETQTLPLAIYSYMQVPGQEGLTTRFVVISIIIALAAMIVSEWYLKKLKNDRA